MTCKIYYAICFLVNTCEDAYNTLCLLSHLTMTTIFISHSADVKDTARELSNQLGEAGARVWFDEEQLVPGDSIAGEISKAIDASDAVLFLISGARSKNRWLSSEVATALAHGKKIVPVVTDSKAEVPLLLRDRLYLDLSRQPDLGAAARKVMQAISRPLEEEKEVAFRTERIQAEREQLEQEQKQLALLKEKREVEIRSMTFSAMFVAMCIAGAFLFYFLERKPGEFNFLWSVIGILVGAATAEVGHYFRSKIQIKALDREAQQ